MSLPRFSPDSSWPASVDRRHERRWTGADMKVASATGSAILVDICASGLGVEVARRLRVGVTYPFRLGNGGSESVVYGLVRWCRAVEAARFRVGLSIGKVVGPPPAERDGDQPG